MSELIMHRKPKSPVAEAYRTLRTNIQFASFDKDIKTVVVTSSGPTEGKSTTAGNLAISMAEMGKKVLLIDCDLRRPSIHKKFKISNQEGLSNLLVENAKVEDVAVKFMDNLLILTSGKIPPNPAEMLSSNKMRNFISEMKEEFDFIILDTPPVIAVTDAQILSTMADGVLLVVSSGQAEREAVERSKTLLVNVGANILGVVLNKVEINSRRGYGYYYYYGNEKEGNKVK
ncbi:CpsD/CapB family tyrosine-protein kinase [Fervidicella metallireducens]|uniref:CpsD/CapB family tyrosine-protein kinase n=1 Tax=Fervidicella metallireducens TaxID=655338 RepID=UPI0005563A20|nr:CpsD/CapB family tyrosine-protein kinase [Fervidicella metallireducens]